MEVSDLAHPYGLLVGWPDAPSPTKMVLPVQRVSDEHVHAEEAGCCTGLHGNKSPVCCRSAR